MKLRQSFLSFLTPPGSFECRFLSFPGHRQQRKGFQRGLHRPLYLARHARRKSRVNRNRIATSPLLRVTSDHLTCAQLFNRLLLTRTNNRAMLLSPLHRGHRRVTIYNVIHYFRGIGVSLFVYGCGGGCPCVSVWVLFFDFRPSFSATFESPCSLPSNFPIHRHANFCQYGCKLSHLVPSF